MWARLGGISPISETQDLRAAGVQVYLAGIDSAMIGSIIGDVRQGKPATVYFGLMTDARALVADPSQAFVGRVDVVAIDDEGATARVTVNLESRFIEPRSRASAATRTRSSSFEYPGDLGMEFVEQAALHSVPPPSRS